MRLLTWTLSAPLAKKCKMSNLFPPCAFIGGCGVDDLNAGDSIIFEITSMGGQMAIETNKISRKISTFETLFRDYKEALPADISKVKVCFVYNGADFVDVQQKFKTRTKLFKTFVVHLPIKACLEWSSKEEANAAAKEANAAVKKAQAETRQAKAAAAAATAENQLLKRRLAELEGAQVVAADVSALEPTTKRIRLADTAHDSRRDGDATEISQRHHISGSRRAGGAGQSVSASARVNKHIYFDW